jgi:hypothetical protein
MKQSSRIKILTFLFLITGLGATFVFVKDSSFVKGSESSIKISVDSSSLNKVTLNYNHQTTVLTKTPLKWMVNGKYEARPNLIQLMTIGLSKSEVKRPVAKENEKKVTDFLNKNGIKVKVDGEDWSKNFIISPNENDANSSYYIEEGSSEPLVVYVPGFKSNMANLLKMTEAEWRSKELFISTPLSLQKISVSYPAYKLSNVEIKWNSDKTFKVEGVNKVDSSKVITYLSQFEQVYIDNYIYKDKEKILLALRKNAPQAIIEVSDLNPGGSHKLSIYEECKDPKGIYAIVEPENELVTMKHETLYRILVRKEFFEKK